MACSMFNEVYIPENDCVTKWTAIRSKSYRYPCSTPEPGGEQVKTPERGKLKCGIIHFFAAIVNHGAIRQPRGETFFSNYGL